MHNVDRHQYIIAALAGTSFGGFFTSALHDPLVHQVLGAILMSIAAVFGTWVGNWFKTRFAPRHPVIATVAEQIVTDLQPLIEKYGYENVVRMIVRKALVSPPLPESALPPMTGKFQAVPPDRVPTNPGSKR